MTLFDRLKIAINFLEEDELIYSIEKPTLSPVSSKPEEPIIDEKEKLPFHPIRKPPSVSLFQKSLNFSKLEKKAPKVIDSTVSVSASAQPSENMPLDSFLDVRSTLKSIAKDYKILETLPDDREAKRLAKLYENKSNYPDCIILYEKAQKKGINLLSALAFAINKTFFNCQLISIDEIEEKEILEEILKDKKIRLIICPQQTLWHHPKLLSHYLETPGNIIKRLATKDLFVLSDLEYYLKDPSLKRSLWNNLIAYFRKS